MTRRHAEIAGAGFAGLAAAIALCQRGWSVRVHEASVELREAGAGIFLWDNGIATLRALGVAEPVLAGAHFAPSSDVLVDGELRSRQPTNTPDTYAMLTMTRQHLYAAMLAGAHAAGAQIVAGSRVTGADDAGALYLEDGGRVRADLVIAADGVNSAVRESLAIATERQRYDDGIVRTLVTLPALPAGDALRVRDWWVRSPLPRRVLWVPCGGDVVYLAMMARVDDARGAATPIDRSLWTSLFPALADAIARIGEAFRYDVYRSTTLARWSRGRVAVIGDAAHAMPPTLGQGAGFAMGNALALADALDRHAHLSDALAAWEAHARPLTEQIQRRAIALARLGAARIDVPKGTLGRLHDEVAPEVP